MNSDRFFLKPIMLAMLLTVAGFISGCTHPEKEKMLARTWIIKEYTHDPPLKGKEARIFQQGLPVLIENSYLRFNPDKTYEFNFQGGINSGTWKIAPDGETLLTESKLTGETENTIKELTPDKMVLYLGRINVQILTLVPEKTN